MQTKTYKMLKTTQGSRDGLTVDTFNKGRTYPLSPELAEQFYHQGAVEEVAPAEDAPADARNRSTKVIAPKETKVTEAEGTKAGEAGVDLGTQHIEELVALARDHYGLDVDSTMGEEELRALIGAAEEEVEDEDPEPNADGKTTAKKPAAKKPVKSKR